MGCLIKGDSFISAPLPRGAHLVFYGEANLETKFCFFPLRRCPLLDGVRRYEVWAYYYPTLRASMSVMDAL